MKTYLALVVLALSLALAGCPKEEPTPVNTPDPETTKQNNVEGTGTVDPK